MFKMVIVYINKFHHDMYEEFDNVIKINIHIQETTNDDLNRTNIVNKMKPLFD
jgi:hypothetical protein